MLDERTAAIEGGAGPGLLRRVADLGGALIGLGRLGEAEELLVACDDVLSGIDGLAPRFRDRAARWLIGLYEQTGRGAQAAALRDRG